MSIRDLLRRVLKGPKTPRPQLIMDIGARHALIQFRAVKRGEECLGLQMATTATVSGMMYGSLLYSPHYD